MGRTGQWQADGLNWYEASDAADASRSRDGQLADRSKHRTSDHEVPSLGIVSSEPVLLGRGTGLKVVDVAPGSPAQQAGIEPGDILVKANGVTLESQAQLDAAYRTSGGAFAVTVRDVRTDRDVLVDIAPPAAATDDATTAPALNRGMKPIGVTTELAFYQGEAALKVTRVESGSAAQRFGVEPGLLILKANGKPLANPMICLKSSGLPKPTLNSKCLIRATVA